MVLQDHRCLPTNEFKRDLNVTIISAAQNLVKYCLRLKEAMKSCCNPFHIPSFLTKDEWKTAAPIEAVMHSTSRLTTIFQTENKLNTAHRPVMRKIIYDVSLRGSLKEIDSGT